MKRFIASILFFVALLSFTAAPPLIPSGYAANGYGATALTGGTAGCLDAINGASLADGDKAFVLTATQFYFYNLDVDSAAAESSPNVISPDTDAGDKRWIKLSAHAIFGLSSLTEGDVPYASAANTLSSLAIGAANYKAFVNAAGTAPEWAIGHMTGTFTREMDAATGTAAITGVGFKPSMVLFFGGINGGLIASIFGASMSTRNYAIAQNGVADQFAVAPAMSILLKEDAATKYQAATMSTYDADGFTLSWIRLGATAAGTATLFYIAFR